MKFKREFLYIFILLFMFSTLSNLGSFLYKKKSTEEEIIIMAKSYIKKKYNEQLDVSDVSTYSKKGNLDSNTISEAIIATSDGNYNVLIDLNTNKVYDNKQYLEIKNAVKNNIVLNNVTNTHYNINELIVFQKALEKFELTTDKLGFFDYNAYYDGDIIKLLKGNNLNIDVNISFENTFGKSYYKDRVLEYINNTKPYFTGGQSIIFVTVYKESRFNNKSDEKKLCEIYSYQRKDKWKETVYQQNFVKINNSLEASSLISNYNFTSYEDCIFEEIELPPSLEPEKSNYKFASNLYYINYKDDIINRYKVGDTDPISIKVNKRTFENGALYNGSILGIMRKNKNNIYTFTDVNFNNSYVDGDYIIVNMLYDSSLVLLTPKEKYLY